jgi:hypothetical protein
MATAAKSSDPLGRLFRFIVFLLSSGYLYPHVCTETMDMKEYEAEVNKQIKKDNS